MVYKSDYNLRIKYHIAGYFRNRNFRTRSKILISKDFNFKECIFRSPDGFQINGNLCHKL